MPTRALLLLLAIPWRLPAQATLGSAAVSGTVRDPSGAPVPGAAVTLVESARGLTRATRTNESGSFLFPTVSAGV